MKDAWNYNQIMGKLRTFFQEKKGYIEVPTQSRLSILAACEDPETITQYSLGGIDYPLPQTGQMWLEYELLQNPGSPGFFCATSSYRDEPNLIEGRHQRLFPLFEFEGKGTVDDLQRLERELLEFLGFGKPILLLYDDLCNLYKTDQLHAEHEEKMWKKFGPVISLEKFPQRSDPYWNMKHEKDGIYNKIDVILYGMETFGTAERSSNKEEMRNDFFTVSGGKYAQVLFDKFGKDRVLTELEEYLSLPMIPRFGGGIGITRLERAMQIARLLEDIPEHFVMYSPQPFAQATL